jgi:hypothetical protein
MSAVGTMTRRITTLAVGVVLALSIGATGVAGAAVKSLDERFAAVAKEAPAFGGMYVDEGEGVLTVYLTDRRAGARSGARRALGKAFRGQGLPRTLRVVRGRYDFARLNAWHDRISADVLAIPGVVLTDIDDRKNRLTVGVESEEARALVAPRLAAFGIPSGAVSIEKEAPVRFATSLRTRHRPLVGGLQISFTHPEFSSLCTLGFNAIRQSVQGFVTNSHCTGVQGGVESTVYHQPTASGTTNRVGVETVDPVYFTGGSCPVGRRCRFSDSAFARRLSGVTANLGRVARSVLGSIAWNGTEVYRIVRKSDPVVGQFVEKVGRTTGRTGGTVRRTCAHLNVNNSDVSFRCQAQASLSPAPGDSGSPVFSPSGPDATLRGELWGGDLNTGVGSFSPIVSGIERELGALTTCASGFSC